MDIEAVIKKLITNLSNIFTSNSVELNSIMASPGFREISNNPQLKKFFITSASVSKLLPANDDQPVIIDELHLSANDIGEMGGQLIIHEDQASTVNLSDTGWMRVKNEDVKFIDDSLNDFLYDTFVHESGVVLQIEPSVEIKFWEFKA